MFRGGGSQQSDKPRQLPDGGFLAELLRQRGGGDPFPPSLQRRQPLRPREVTLFKGSLFFQRIRGKHKKQKSRKMSKQDLWLDKEYALKRHANPKSAPSCSHEPLPASLSQRQARRMAAKKDWLRQEESRLRQAQYAAVASIRAARKNAEGRPHASNYGSGRSSSMPRHDYGRDEYSTDEDHQYRGGPRYHGSQDLVYDSRWRSSQRRSSSNQSHFSYDDENPRTWPLQESQRGPWFSPNGDSSADPSPQGVRPNRPSNHSAQRYESFQQRVAAPETVSKLNDLNGKSSGYKEHEELDYASSSNRRFRDEKVSSARGSAYRMRAISSSDNESEQSLTGSFTNDLKFRMADRRFQKQSRARAQAATHLQAIARGMLARNRTGKERAREKSVVTLQAWARGSAARWLARAEQRIQIAEEKDIRFNKQKGQGTKGKVVRQSLRTQKQRFLREYEASSRIQAVVRGRNSRRASSKLIRLHHRPEQRRGYTRKSSMPSASDYVSRIYPSNSKNTRQRSREDMRGIERLTLRGGVSPQHSRETFDLHDTSRGHQKQSSREVVDARDFHHYGDESQRRFRRRTSNVGSNAFLTGGYRSASGELLEDPRSNYQRQKEFQREVMDLRDREYNGSEEYSRRFRRRGSVGSVGSMSGNRSVSSYYDEARYGSNRYGCTSTSQMSSPVHRGPPTRNIAHNYHIDPNPTFGASPRGHEDTSLLPYSSVASSCVSPLPQSSGRSPRYNWGQEISSAPGVISHAGSVDHVLSRSRQRSSDENFRANSRQDSGEALCGVSTLDNRAGPLHQADRRILAEQMQARRVNLDTPQRARRHSLASPKSRGSNHDFRIDDSEEKQQRCATPHRQSSNKQLNRTYDASNHAYDVSSNRTCDSPTRNFDSTASFSAANTSISHSRIPSPTTKKIVGLNDKNLSGHNLQNQFDLAQERIAALEAQIASHREVATPSSRSSVQTSAHEPANGHTAARVGVDASNAVKVLLEKLDLESVSTKAGKNLSMKQQQGEQSGSGKGGEDVLSTETSNVRPPLPEPWWRKSQGASPGGLSIETPYGTSEIVQARCEAGPAHSKQDEHGHMQTAGQDPSAAPQMSTVPQNFPNGNKQGMAFHPLIHEKYSASTRHLLQPQPSNSNMVPGPNPLMLGTGVVQGQNQFIQGMVQGQNPSVQGTAQGYYVNGAHTNFIPQPQHYYSQAQPVHLVPQSQVIDMQPRQITFSPQNNAPHQTPAHLLQRPVHATSLKRVGEARQRARNQSNQPSSSTTTPEKGEATGIFSIFSWGSRSEAPPPTEVSTTPPSKSNSKDIAAAAQGAASRIHLIVAELGIDPSLPLRLKLDQALVQCGLESTGSVAADLEQAVAFVEALRSQTPVTPPSGALHSPDETIFKV